jgi:hypothetical protein
MEGSSTTKEGTEEGKYVTTFCEQKAAKKLC